MVASSDFGSRPALKMDSVNVCREEAGRGGEGAVGRWGTSSQPRNLAHPFDRSMARGVTVDIRVDGASDRSPLLQS